MVRGRKYGEAVARRIKIKVVGGWGLGGWGGVQGSAVVSTTEGCRSTEREDYGRMAGGED